MRFITKKSENIPSTDSPLGCKFGEAIRSLDIFIPIFGKVIDDAGGGFTDLEDSEAFNLACCLRVALDGRKTNKNQDEREPHCNHHSK